MRVSVLFILTLLCAACASTQRRPAAVDFSGPTDSVLLMSDIHFDPLYDPSIVPALIQNTDGSQWASIFESSQITTFSTYGTDANFPILKSSLEAMKKVDPNPRMIIVGGDFLPHKFEKHFKALAPDSAAQFKPFADATLRVVAQMVQAYFPNALILPAIGNNDDSCGDYVSQPSGASLSMFAKAWAPAAVRDNSSTDFVAGVESYGHYTELLPAVGGGQALRLIVVNGVYWSPRYSNTCGDVSANPGADELTWLEKQLETSKSKGEKVWLVNHIPAGVDVATTVFKDPNYCASKKLITMLKPEPNGKYLNLIKRFRSVIAASINGHTHYSEFRVYGENQDAIPAITIPSIAPNHENNPAFQVLTVDPATFAIHNISVYSVDIDQSARNPSWNKLYDFDQLFQQSEVSAASLSQVLQKARNYNTESKDIYSRFMNSGAKPSPFMTKNWDLYICGMTRGSAEAVATCACPAAN
jgi:sphingomyelin phosphodiesterase acid-like 3